MMYSSDVLNKIFRQILSKNNVLKIAKFIYKLFRYAIVYV